MTDEDWTNCKLWKRKLYLIQKNHIKKNVDGIVVKNKILWNILYKESSINLKNACRYKDTYIYLNFKFFINDLCK